MLGKTVHLLYNKYPKILWLKTTFIVVSLGQESECDLAVILDQGYLQNCN